MHYYQFNIGDYISHTRHLNVIEDCAYRRLLDLYYLHEQPINDCLTTVARSINMREYESEVSAVLHEFFELVDGSGWVNRRADEEISKYRLKLEAASRAGKASAERRLNERSTVVQLNKKQETRNTKQETDIKAPPVPCPDGVLETTWADFVKQRKAKKAPITTTAVKGIQREANKAGLTLDAALQLICLRGWTGFNAEWVKTNAEKSLTPNQASNLAFARAIFGDERNIDDGQRTIDITPPAQVAGFLGTEDF